MEIKRCIFSGMQILNEGKWLHDHALVVEDNLIKAIIPAEMVPHHLPAKQHTFSPQHYLIPGLIDLHIHGAQGKDVMDATPEAIKTISHALAAEGVTGFLATTMTADNAQIEAVLNIIPPLTSYKEGAAILGVHLEGPFIAKEKVGAQSGEQIQSPNPTQMRHWQSKAQGAIKIVTLAPELPGAIELIKALHEMNIIASIGHTNASYAQTLTAIHAGCSQATHLFNAMRGLHQREPGAAGALLLSDRIAAELIVDGIHLHPAMVELVLRVKGRDRILLITDAMRAKCLKDGEYKLGNNLVEVRAGNATLKDGTLAGSTLCMPQAIQNMVQFTHCSLAEAISMATINPAIALGISAYKGSININKDADLVVLDKTFNVVLTMREGREIYSK